MSTVRTSASGSLARPPPMLLVTGSNRTDNQRGDDDGIDRVSTCSVRPNRGLIRKRVEAGTMPRVATAEIIRWSGQLAPSPIMPAFRVALIRDGTPRSDRGTDGVAPHSS
jgi:hypothetical protein